MDLYELEDRYIKLAQKIQKEFDAKVLVVRINPEQVVKQFQNQNGFSIYVVNGKRDAEISNYCNNSEIKAQFIPDIRVILSSDKSQIDKWLEEKGFLNGILFHRIVYTNYDPKIRDKIYLKYGLVVWHYLQRLHQIVQKEMWEKVHDSEISKDIIGQKEQEELIVQAQQIAEKLKDTDANMIIALDVSGRPVGLLVKRILKEVYKIDLPLFFFNPNVLKVRFNQDKELDELTKLFQREYPILSKKINSSKIILLDDQIASGTTFSLAYTLLSKLGAKKVDPHYLSSITDNHEPSWRNAHRDSIGIKESSNSFTTSRDIRDRQKMKILRDRLKTIAMKVRERMTRYN